MCILVVDAEPITLMVMAKSLGDVGYAVMVARHAADAITMLAEHPGLFTGLVTDLHMSGELSGAHLVENMREQYPAAPIILTAALGSVTSPEWRSRHHVELLTKPYTPQALVEVVRRLVKQSQSRHLETWNGRLVRLEGEEAQACGKPRWQNPYVFGTQEHGAWEAGWNTADGLEP